MKIIYNYIIVLMLLVLSLNASEYQTLEDSEHSYKITIPSSWTVSKSKKNSDSMRFTAISPDSKQLVQLYHLSISGNIDISKFATLYTKQFKKLGAIENRVEDGNYFFGISAVDITHKKNRLGYYGLSHYEVSYSHGYIILAYSKNKDFSTAKKIIDSLTIESFTGLGTSMYNGMIDKILDKILKYWWVPVALLFFFLQDLRDKVMNFFGGSKKSEDEEVESEEVPEAVEIVYGQETPIKSEFTGILWKLPLNVNHRVSKGDIIAFVEADGLVVDILSPVDGLIKSILVAENDKVEVNKVLMIMA